MRNAQSYGLVWLVLAAFFLTACEGDSGPPGPEGPSGPSGPPGNQGPPGTAPGLPIESAAKINANVTSVVVAAGGGQTTINFTLTNDLGQGLTGLPASHMGFVIAQLSPGSNGSASEWQAYTTNGRTTPPDVQAGYESGSTGTYDDVGDGTFSYTFAQGLTAYPAGPTYDESKIHRVGFEIRTNRGLLPYNIPSNNAPYDFRPVGGPVDRDDAAHRLIIDNETCNACHDNLELHGEARFDTDYCVQCHNPYSIDPDTANEAWGGTVDMTEMVHKIHMGANLANGYFIVGFGGTVHDYSNVIFSQDVRNCQTCHNDSRPNVPQASNWTDVVTRLACGACHDDIDWAGGGHPGSAVFVSDEFCVDCHGPTSQIAGGSLRTAVVHTIPRKVAADDFQFNIENVTGTGPGGTPVIDISVSNPNTGTNYDLHADAPWTQCADFTSRLAVNVAFSTTDYTNTGSGNGPGQPITMNPLPGGCFGGSTNIGNNVFRVTAPTQIPMNAVGTAAVTIDGHPSVPIDGQNESIAVANAVDYASITDADPDQNKRRNAVALDKCNDCHNTLAIHGNNRTDNIEVCVTCHNPNATDINRRNPPCSNAPNDPMTPGLGPDDVSVDMKYMIHALHAGGATGVAYDVCGFGNRPHSFDFVYPGRLNNCEGCHEPGGYYPVDPAAVLGTTIDAGADALSPADDVVVSPNTAVCSACHVSSLAAEHMRQNGGDFNAGKTADSVLISSGVETCSLCHGPGRSADVATMHGVGTFRVD